MSVIDTRNKAHWQFIWAARNFARKTNTALPLECAGQTGNRIVRSPTLGRETKPDIFCEWNTKFSIIPEIPSKRVHSKRIPKFSKTFPGIFTVPFNFGPEISEFLVEWKAPYEPLDFKIFWGPYSLRLATASRIRRSILYPPRFFSS